MVGLLATWITVALADMNVSSPGPHMAVAGIAEETLKLVPVALVAVLAPRRVARFAAVDWLLMGLASGTAFLLVEEGVRRVGLSTGRVGMLDAAFGSDHGVPLSWIRFGTWPLPTDWTEAGRGYGGHAVTTAIVAGAVGLSIAAVRAVRGRTGFGPLSVRAAAGAVPALALVTAIADHAAFNGGSSLTCTGDTPCWLDPSATHVPWWIRAPWSMFGHGHARATVFVVLVVVLLILDGARLARVPAAGLAATPRPAWIDRAALASGRATCTWPVALRTAVVQLVFGILGAAWVLARDVATSVAAFASDAGQPRRVAARRGAGLLSAQRAARELGYDALSPPTRPGLARSVASGALGLLLLGAFVLAPATARNIETAYDSPFWLAGILNAIAGWWHHQPLVTQIAIGAGIAALIVLSGGSLGLAMGVSGVATWALDRSAGIGTFIQDPDRATRDYFATTTPARLASDTLGVALTFAPGNFGGAIAGRGLRTATEELVADPAAFWAARRISIADDAGHIDLDWLLARKPVPLADGTLQPALSHGDEAAALSRYESQRAVPTKGKPGPARDGQVAVYGDNERAILLPDGKQVHPDGFTSTYGAIGDYKHVTADASTWYVPETLDQRIRDVAISKMDTQLRRLQRAASVVAPDGRGVVEITTNSPSAASFIEDRMTSAGIRGYVRLVEGTP